ncbi:QRFP-like peptide receptor [Anneissia japonica]|uniref:QRFP-like peptide receptor n=1 Tax=Anneissia japonica TaxID=1529436 RepID=UPI0014254DA7|nr:QRFP-like peptide receptor [Anneissia japonica]XP_033122297.1 QRFP-like peptide receptor [Anneissia japonica]
MMPSCNFYIFLYVRKWPYHLFTCICIVLFIIGCTGNVAVIFLIRRCRQLRGAPVILLVNLAVADILVCLTYFPLYIYISLTQTRPLIITSNNNVCAVTLFLEFQSQLCSALTIASINFERCFVLKYPLRVRTVITFKRKLLVTAGIWVISTLCSIHVIVYPPDFITPVFNDEFDKWQPTTQFIIPAVIVVVSCIITALTLIKRIHSNRLHESNQSNVSTGNSLRNPKKALKTVIIVAVVFLCMTSPSAIFRFWIINNGYHFSAKTWLYFANLLRVSNSCVNPFIYALMSSSFRSAIKSTFCCKTDSTNRQNLNFNSRSRPLQNRV